MDPGAPVAGRRALAAGLWMGATVVGLAVGGFVFHFPGSFGGVPDRDTPGFAVIAAILLAAGGSRWRHARAATGASRA